MIFSANNDKIEQPLRIRDEMMLGSYENFYYGGDTANRVGACSLIN